MNVALLVALILTLRGIRRSIRKTLNHNPCFHSHSSDIFFLEYALGLFLNCMLPMLQKQYLFVKTASNYRIIFLDLIIQEKP